MASYVAEFVILNEIFDFRDICEGSTDDTFVILCAVATLMYVSPYFWQILVVLLHKRALSDKCWSQIRSVYLIWRNICYTEQIILHWKSYTPQIKKTQIIIYTVNRIKDERSYGFPPTLLIIFKLKKVMCTYQTNFEWRYVVQFQETLFNGVSFNFLGLLIWALYTVRLWEIRNHQKSFLTNYFYYLLFEWVCVVFLALLHIRSFFIVYY